jgi:hypothetical protein
MTPFPIVVAQTCSSLDVERVSIAVSQQQDFCDRAAALQNPQFPHTQAQACHAIVQLLPSMLAINKRQYRS